MIMLWLRCPVEMEPPTWFATVWESIDQSLHRIIDSSVVNTFILDPICSDLLSRWSCISFQKLSLLLLSPFDFKLTFLCGTCHDFESIIIYTNSLSYISFVVCLWWNIVYDYKWKLSCQLTGITVKFWSFQNVDYGLRTSLNPSIFCTLVRVIPAV